MQIFINGSATEVEASIPMSALVEQLGLTGRRIAVEVNAELVPRSRFAQHVLVPEDRVEIIQAVGGG
ncbi:MAG: sulfur carrier protein ThiS [Lamprocystis purpurea]|jgi:sulfur carrier protein|uniref:sulfur carrier protein ThiS n=1 Tax=Lamprocystis purpurea TaxID=61598 RepID=UPI00037B9A95|nr:sulfur carrier protein ThiS [Lamprocystis purpurea]MBV5274877.1 sulfur carrier protein ThiS [Lamprocystis purpurea]